MFLTGSDIISRMSIRPLTPCDSSVLFELWERRSARDGTGMTIKELFASLAKSPNCTEKPTLTAVKKSCRKLLDDNRITMANMGGAGKPGRAPAAFRIKTERMTTSQTSAEIVLRLYHGQDEAAANQSVFLNELKRDIEQLGRTETVEDLRERVDHCVSRGYLVRHLKENKTFLIVVQDLVDADVRYLELIRLFPRSKKRGPESVSGPSLDGKRLDA